MLVLTRKLNEQILIGDGIVITVVAIRGGQVRLGVDAPRQIPITRPKAAPKGEADLPAGDVRQPAEPRVGDRGESSSSDG